MTHIIYFVKQAIINRNYEVLFQFHVRHHTGSVETKIRFG